MVDPSGLPSDFLTPPGKGREKDAGMARTDEAQAFFHAVYSAIQEIPHGKVTSYGHIARLIGTRESAAAS
jgi:O6-methylguanine-DNA--protein-cysteine methyltransferase